MKAARYILVAILLGAMCTGAAKASVRITNISDFNLPTWSIGNGPINAYIDLCIYNSAVLPLGGPYAITVSSAGGFKLTSGASQIPYTLKWEDSGVTLLGLNGGSPLLNGVKLTGLMNANTLSETCAWTVLIPAGANARLYLSITQADMLQALAGTYNGTITLLLSAS